MGEVVVRADVIGAGRLARGVFRAAHELPAVIAAEMRGHLSPALVRTFRVFAPIDTGRLRAKIAAPTRGQTLQVESTAASEAGYHYTGVTRFGHRSARIYPRTASALRFSVDGRTLFRASVRGYHPDHDWAQDALPQAGRDVRATGQRIGRRVAGMIG